MKQLIHTEDGGKKLYSINSFEDLVAGAQLWFHRHTTCWFHQEIIIKSWEPDLESPVLNNLWTDGHPSFRTYSHYWITDVRGREYRVEAKHLIHLYL